MVSKTLSDPFDTQTQPASVLVVDDSEFSAQLVQIYLERAGYEVRLASDGDQALAEVAKDPPDLIILDVMMPGRDGFDVCARLKAESKTWFIPIILLTALNQPRDRIRGIDAGADDFLTKPFNKEELSARVRSLLRLKFARDALQTERNRLAMLYDISQGINSQLALDEVLSTIVAGTRQALGADKCSIIILDEQQRITRQFLSREGSAPEIAGPVTPVVFQEGLAGWLLHHRQGTIVRDTAQDKRWLVLPSDVETVRSVVASPLLVGQQVLGLLLATHAQPDTFGPDHLALLTSIAAQATVAVRNAQLYEAEQGQRQDLELLQAAGVAISAELNSETLFHLIVQQAVSLLDAHAASLLVPDEAGEYLVAKAWHALSEHHVQHERLPISQLAPHLAGDRRSFQVQDLQPQLMGHSDLLQREGITGQLSLALIASGEFLGLLNLYCEHGSSPYDPDQVKLAETFAQQAAIALANAQLLEHTREERGKLSAVLSSTTDAVLAVDQAGKLILINPAAERTFGLPAAAFLGQPLAGCIPPQFLEVFDRVTASGRPVAVEISFDQDKALYVSVSPVAGVGQVAVVQDITPLKELTAMRLKAEQEQRRHIRQVFERYVGPELVDRILAQEEGMLDRRERRNAVVLFTDLRGFSRMTSGFPAHTVIEVLNEFFSAMVEVVHTHEGTVFDLAGDELMVGFGVPFDQEDASWRALRAAGDMQESFDRLRRRWQKQRGIEVGLGVGIDQGTVVMGNIGAASHMNFGLVGNTVNTAHQLVELAQHGEIIVSRALFESLEGTLEDSRWGQRWTFEPLPDVGLKGQRDPLQVYLARRHKSPALEPQQRPA